MSDHIKTNAGEIAPVDKAIRDIITGKDPAGLRRNLFVSAGAGAGKTACIVDRVMTLLVETPLNIERLAVITYTTKAAAELKERTRVNLERRVASASTPSEKSRAGQQLDELSKAKISTVHSFCLDLIKEYPVEFGRDPDCSIADDRLTASILTEVKRRFYLAEAEPASASQASYMALKNLRMHHAEAMTEDTLFTIFDLLYKNRELVPAAIELKVSQNPQMVHQSVCDILRRLIKFLLVDIEVQIKSKDDKLYAKIPDIAAILAAHGVTTASLANVDSLAAALLAGANVPFPGNIGSLAAYKDKAALSSYKDGVKELKAAIATAKQGALIACYNLILEAFPAYRTLYDEFKSASGLLDFADCLITVRDGLRSQHFLRKELQQRFDVLIVDEFQDSDPLQSEIIFYLSGQDPEDNGPWDRQTLKPGKLVLMGDPKQSIFGFARADIRTYLKVKELLVAVDAKSSVALSTNFRSTPELVSFLNESFGDIIKPIESVPFASPQYEDMHAYKNAGTSGAGLEVLELNLEPEHLARSRKTHDKYDKLRAEERRSRESWTVASWIKEQIRTGSSSYGDFLILFRTSTAMADYEWALDRLQVPVLNTKTSAFLTTPEARNLIALLGVLVDPNHGQYIYAALRSVFFGFDDARLQRLFVAAGRKPSLSSLAKIEPELLPLLALTMSGEALPARFEAACRSYLFTSTGMAVGLKELPAAIVRMSNLIQQELVLADFDEQRALDTVLGGAIVERTYDKATKEFESDKLLLQAPRTNKVRLMTVHAAKGLESKFVILASPGVDAMIKFDSLIDRDHGTIIPLTNKIYDTDMLDLPQLQESGAIEAVFKKEEEKRVLYVASSRAIERLCIVRHLGDKIGSFLEPLQEAIDHAPAVTKLDVPENFASRHAMTHATPALNLGNVTHDAWQDQQLQASKRLGLKSFKGLAVTTATKETAERLFDNSSRGSGGGRALGMLVHEVMETICLRARAKVRMSGPDVEHLVTINNASAHGIPENNLAKVRSAISTFLNTKLYADILAAKIVFPEVPFRQEDGTRGVIDLVYIDDHGAHVVDWKSDVFKDADRETAVVSLYKKQIEAYRSAVEKMLGEKVTSVECIFLMKTA